MGDVHLHSYVCNAFAELSVHHSIDVKIEDLHLRAVRAGDESGVCQARQPSARPPSLVTLSQG